MSYLHSATIIIQARMSSSRLPGKVMQDLGGEPVLARMMRRARRAACAADVIVATTTDPSDDGIEAFCRSRGYPVFRGSLNDVLDRFYQAAVHFDARIIARLTADCPLIDPGLIDASVAALLGAPPPAGMRYSDSSGQPVQPGRFSFAANRLPPPWKRTFPIGLDTEVCTFDGLERAWKEAVQGYEREHVMPYFYDQPGRFPVVVLDHDPDCGQYRWTIDTLPDLEAVRAIYTAFGNRDDFTWLEALDLVQRHPEISAINAGVRHKSLTEVDERAKSAHS